MKASLPFKYITSEKNGKHYVIFDFRDDEGKRKRKWVCTNLSVGCSNKALTAMTKEIVAAFYEEYLTGNLTKADPAKKPKTVKAENSPNSENEIEFRAFLLKWLDIVKPSISNNTFIGYRGVVTRITEYFDKYYPGLLLSELTPLHLQQYYNEKYNSGASASTVKHYHANIHKALRYAVKVDFLNVNVADKVDLPKMEKFEANFYSKEELDKLFELFKGDRLELVVHIAAYYGLRKSEILGLKWDSIDFDAKTITVRRKISNSYGNGKEEIIVENQLKTRASVRTFPLIPHIEKMLKERKYLESYYSKLLGPDFDREFDGFVCRDNTGKLISPNFVTSHFHYVMKRNDLKKIRFHDLRHSCASLLLANGVSMKAIQEWLGHSTFNVTANFYSHLEYKSKIESAETIAKVLGGDNKEEAEDREKKKRK